MGIEDMTHDYITLFVLAALVLIVMALTVRFWIARLRSQHEARLKTPVPRRVLHINAFGRASSAQAAAPSGKEPEYLEAARQNLKSQLGPTVRPGVAKGPALVKR